MADSINTVSSSLEDYLESIYILCQNKENVRMTDIAKFLKVSKPSVNRAIGNLQELGYLSHETYGKITLTESGMSYAKSVLARHILLKEFLTDELGVCDETAEKDACRMEHVMSDESILKLMKYIKNLKK